MGRLALVQLENKTGASQCLFLICYRPSWYFFFQPSRTVMLETISWISRCSTCWWQLETRFLIAIRFMNWYVQFKEQLLEFDQFWIESIFSTRTGYICSCFICSNFLFRLLLKCHCVNSIAGQADPFIFIVGARYIPATVYFPSFMNPFSSPPPPNGVCREPIVWGIELVGRWQQNLLFGGIPLSMEKLRNRFLNSRRVLEGREKVN